VQQVGSPILKALALGQVINLLQLAVKKGWIQPGPNWRPARVMLPAAATPQQPQVKEPLQRCRPCALFLEICSGFNSGDIRCRLCSFLPILGRNYVASQGHDAWGSLLAWNMVYLWLMSSPGPLQAQVVAPVSLSSEAAPVVSSAPVVVKAAPAPASSAYKKKEPPAWLTKLRKWLPLFLQQIGPKGYPLAPLKGTFKQASGEPRGTRRKLGEPVLCIAVGGTVNKCTEIIERWEDPTLA
jgi:hypothetical protein